jgi:hypothetical protein
VCTLLLSMALGLKQPQHRFLIVNFDNCWSENKHRWMLGLCDLLVKMFIFERVEVICLPPGHTHHRIDAFFSHLQRGLDFANLGCLSDILAALPRAFVSARSRPTVVAVQQVWDFKTWLGAELAPLAGHSSPLGFLFKRDFSAPLEPGQQPPVKMWIRAHSKAPWIGVDNTPPGIDVLLGSPNKPLLPLPLRHFEAFAVDAMVSVFKKSDRYIGKERAQLLGKMLRTESLGVVAEDVQTPGVGLAASLPTPAQLLPDVHTVATQQQETKQGKKGPFLLTVATWLVDFQ